MSAARQELAGKYRAVSAYTGLVLLICGLLMLLPLAGLIEEPREAADVWGFLAPALVLAGLGLGLWRGLGPGDAALTVREGRVVVLFGWLGVCLVSAWPFMAVMNLPLHLAVFESVSGWSTTGLSILDVEAAPRTILLWRSVTQFAGGAGLAVIMLASIAGPAGSGLTEAAGRSEQLVPNVRSSARTVLGIYLAYALAATASYRVLGMDLFDAVNHAMATVSTGGFSTRAASIGYWNSMGLEAAVMVFMLLGSLNFLTAHLVVHGRASALFKGSEVRLAALLLALGAALLALSGQGACPGLRRALFAAVSAASTTGFTTSPCPGFGPLGLLVMLLLMIAGGQTGSTAGGLKQYRLAILLRELGLELRRTFLPKAVVKEAFICHGGERIFLDEAMFRRCGAFLLLYLLVLVCGTGVLALHGAPLGDALFEFASAQGTVGLSVGLTGPDAAPGVLWTEACGMFLGRLEFFAIISAIIKVARDLRLAARKNGP